MRFSPNCPYTQGRSPDALGYFIKLAANQAPHFKTHSGGCVLINRPLFTKAWRIDEYVGAQGDFMAPVWPVKLIILIGCAAGAIQFLLMAIGSLNQLKASENKSIDTDGGIL
jgi:hypothetical protein